MVFLQRKGVWVKIGSFRIGLLLTLPKRKNNWIQCEVGDYYEFKNGINKGKDFFGKGTPIVNFKDVFHHRGLT
ncbi:hypothetical protein F6I03_07495, partial [Aerococcus sanguinicola]